MEQIYGIIFRIPFPYSLFIHNGAACLLVAEQPAAFKLQHFSGI